MPKRPTVQALGCLQQCLCEATTKNTPSKAVSCLDKPLFPLKSLEMKHYWIPVLYRRGEGQRGCWHVQFSSLTPCLSPALTLPGVMAAVLGSLSHRLVSPLIHKNTHHFTPTFSFKGEVVGGINNANALYFFVFSVDCTEYFRSH